MSPPLRILHLEDSNNDAELILEKLVEEGLVCDIQRVENKADFIAALDRCDIDLVLADYALPSFDGMSALAIALDKCPDMPFIFVSGTIGEDVAIQALKSGATDYVLKSKLSRLAPAMRRALNETNDRVTRKLAGAALRESEDRYRSLFNNSIDAIILATPDGRIHAANSAACRIFGLTEEEFRRLGRAGIVDSSDQRLLAALEQRDRMGNFSGEITFVRTDGTRFPGDISSTIYTDSHGVPKASIIIRDITERRRVEEELGRLNRILQARSRSSKAMMHTKDEQEYLTEVCRIIIEDCGHALVWIGYAEDNEAKTVRPVAHAGFEDGYLESAKITWADNERGRGPVGMAIRTGKPALFRNILTDPTFAPWRKEALKRGYASVIGIPLLKDGKAYGSLNIYSREQDPFSDDEVRLLSDLAADLSYGIAAIRLRTTHDEAETALRKSESRFRALFENMLEGFAYCRMLFENDVPLDFIYLEVNSAFEKLTGLKDVVGKKVSEAIPGIREALPELLAIYGRVALTGKPERFETFSESFGGWLSISVYSTEKEYFVAVFENITERKRAEEALSESESIYRNLFNNTEVGIFRTRLDGSEILNGNDKFFEILGWSREEVIGNPSVIRWADPHQREEMVRRLKANGRVADFECKMLNKKDEVRDCITSLNLYPETGILEGSIIDITERKLAEDQLRESEKRYKKLFDSSLDGIYEVNAEGIFLKMNKAGARVFGYETPDQIIGQQALQYWRDPRDREAFRAELALKKSVSAYHMKAKKKDGTSLELESSSRMLEDESGNFIGIEGILRDVTQRKHAEEEHGKTEEQLRHAQKMEAIGTLAGGVAHDFNNILNVIMGYGGLVLDKMGPDDPSREEMNEVLAAADRAAILTRRLLVFSRKQVMEVKPVDVNDIITGVQKMLSRVIGEDIDLQVNLADKRLTVMADAGQIEQVLMNLATNARDAMPKGGRLVITTETGQMDDAYVAAYGYGKTGAYAVISVADTGKGMDTETQKKIFEPFFTTKGIGEGTGLGLAVSYGIMKQHYGYIKCYSEAGKGTVFKIYLPLIEDTTPAGIKAEAPVIVKGGTETILVGEDDPTLRKLDKVILESFGYSVITAEDGEDTVAKFMENRDRIKLVILDLVMPKKSGKEAYEEIKKTSPGIRTFFLSGYTMDMISRMEIEKGMEVLRKPVAPNDLLRKVREVLDK